MQHEAIVRLVAAGVVSEKVDAAFPTWRRLPPALPIWSSVVSTHLTPLSPPPRSRHRRQPDGNLNKTEKPLTIAE
jgi:hypothetical protein